MGLFDSLFRRDKNTGDSRVDREGSTLVPNSGAPEEGNALPPEVVAAICASVGIVMEEDSSAELIAAVTAAIIHAQGGCLAVRIRSTSNTWVTTGREKLMDSRQ